MKKQEIQFKWFGVAGLEFRFGNQNLLIDPFLTRQPIKNLLFGRVSPNKELITRTIHRAEYILVTHSHYDHLLDVPDIARHSGAQLFGSDNTCRLAQICGIPESQMKRIEDGDVLSLGNVTVKVIPAVHPFLPFYQPGKLKAGLKPPLRLRDYRMDSCYSFLIDTGRLRILVWSSISTQRVVAADALFLRAVARPGWYAEMLEKVHPQTVIPTHWDDMFQPLNRPVRSFFKPPKFEIPPLQRIDLRHFEQTLHQIDPNCRVILPQVFETYDLP